MILIRSATARRQSNWVFQFINIIFLILLFFLINGTITETPQQDILPPITIRSEAGSAPHNGLYVDQSGRLFFQNRQVTEAEFVVTALSRRSTAPRPQLIVVDRRLPAVAMIDLVSSLESAGMSDLSLLTIRPSP
jgi:biopolymer transport protein ExbD